MRIYAPILNIFNVSQDDIYSQTGNLILLNLTFRSYVTNVGCATGDVGYSIQSLILERAGYTERTTL